MLFHRQFADGSLQKFPLQAGPNGFCQYSLGCECISTEVPNILLNIKKRPGAAIARKPAKASKGEGRKMEEQGEGEEKDEDLEDDNEESQEEGHGEEEDHEEQGEEEEVPGEQENQDVPEAEEEEEQKDEDKQKQEVVPVSRSYSAMYYKNGNSIGIRQKFYAKLQVLSFGGKHCGKSESQLRQIAHEVIHKLEAGILSEKDARTFAKEQVSL